MIAIIETKRGIPPAPGFAGGIPPRVICRILVSRLSNDGPAWFNIARWRWTEDEHWSDDSFTVSSGDLRDLHQDKFPRRKRR